MKWCWKTAATLIKYHLRMYLLWGRTGFALVLQWKLSRVGKWWHVYWYQIALFGGVVYPACLIWRFQPSVAYYCHESLLPYNIWCHTGVDHTVTLPYLKNPGWQYGDGYGWLSYSVLLYYNWGSLLPLYLSRGLKMHSGCANELYACSLLLTPPPPILVMACGCKCK